MFSPLLCSGAEGASTSRSRGVISAINVS
jgi:hypothetical protein